MTDAQTISLLGELESAQDRLLAEERLLEDAMEGGETPPEEAFHAWHLTYDHYRDLRDGVLEVVSQEPERKLDSPAFLALEMADIRAEAVESEWEIASLEKLGFTEKDLRLQVARGYLKACRERIAELKARLDLLKVSTPGTAATVVPTVSMFPVETEAGAVEVAR